MKKFVKAMALSIAVMLAASTVGCGTKATEPAKATTTVAAQGTTAETSTPKEKVTVEFAYPSFASAMGAWQGAVDEANKLLEGKNIEIKVNKIPLDQWPVYYQKIVALIAAGNSPDIGRVAESMFPKLIQNDQVVDISDVVAKLDMSQYYENAFKGSAVKDGKTYGIPSGIYNIFLYYNKDLFEKAKLEAPSPDWTKPITYDTLVADAKALTSGSGANKIFGFSGIFEAGWINSYLLSAGAKGLYADDGTCSLDDASNIKVLNYLDQMWRVDKSMPQSTDTKVMGPAEMFKAGKLGMMVTGSWYFPEAKGIKSFKVGIAALPSNGGKAFSTGFLDGWAVFKGAKHEAEAKEAVLALASKEVNDFLSTSGEAGGPIVQSSLEDNKAKILGAPFTEVDTKSYVDSLSNLIKSPYTTNMDDWAPKYNSAVDQFSLGKLTPEAFAKQAKEIIDQGNAAK